MNRRAIIKYPYRDTHTPQYPVMNHRAIIKYPYRDFRTSTTNTGRESPTYCQISLPRFSHIHNPGDESPGDGKII